MHDPECPICRAAIARAPIRTKDRRGVVIEHGPESKPVTPASGTLNA